MAATPTRLILTGGEQRSLRPLRTGFDDWYRFGRGLVATVDLATGTARRVLEYETPPDARAPVDPPILFKQGALDGERLWVCTPTEVLAFRLPAAEPEVRISLPFFHDLHHVRPTAAGTLLVVVTGLDLVAEITTAGDVVREWSVVAGNPWMTRARDVDYRRVRSLKPYAAHPNHVFELDGEPWVTRFIHRDALCLTRPERRIAIGIEQPHDGLVTGDRVWFTTVDGHLACADAVSRAIVETHDLRAMDGRRRIRGWCRGIWLDGRRAWVGFSRFRPTRFRENLAWAGRGFRSFRGTHLACFDLDARRVVAEVELEPIGMNAVFSVLPG